MDLDAAVDEVIEAHYIDGTSADGKTCACGEYLPNERWLTRHRLKKAVAIGRRNYARELLVIVKGAFPDGSEAG
jgi:hypothetical protein